MFAVFNRCYLLKEAKHQAKSKEERAKYELEMEKHLNLCNAERQHATEHHNKALQHPDRYWHWQWTHPADARLW